VTPHQRNVCNVRDAIRFMTLADLRQAVNDATLPMWARNLYAEAVDRLETADRLAALVEVRDEIRRVNRAAGETVFNPAATALLEGVMAALEAQA
jgi:hypothetical protein